MARKESMRTIERNGESELEQKLLTPANWDNGIKTDVVVVIYFHLFFIYYFLYSLFIFIDSLFS